MSDNDECLSRNFGDSLQLTNWILYSGATFHMTPDVPDFIPGSLDDTDKKIEVSDRHRVMAKKGQVRIKMCDDNGDNFIAKIHNILLAPDLCNRLFLIITSMNLGRTFLFHKGFFTVYLVSKEKNAVSLPHSAQRKNAFLGENKGNVKNKEITT